jgi:hypothetical protein
MILRLLPSITSLCTTAESCVSCWWTARLGICSPTCAGMWKAMLAMTPRVFWTRTRSVWSLSRIAHCTRPGSLGGPSNTSTMSQFWRWRGGLWIGWESERVCTNLAAAPERPADRETGLGARLIRLRRGRVITAELKASPLEASGGRSLAACIVLARAEDQARGQGLVVQADPVEPSDRDEPLDLRGLAWRDTGLLQLAGDQST